MMSNVVPYFRVKIWFGSYSECFYVNSASEVQALVRLYDESKSATAINIGKYDRIDDYIDVSDENKNSPETKAPHDQPNLWSLDRLRKLKTKFTCEANLEEIPSTPKWYPN